MDRESKLAAADVPAGTVILWVGHALSGSLARLRFAEEQLRCGRFRSLDTWLARVPEPQAAALRRWFHQVQCASAGRVSAGRSWVWSERERVGDGSSQDAVGDSRERIAAWGCWRLVELPDARWLVVWSRSSDGFEPFDVASVEALAAGLAHDWNNQLSIVGGFCHLLLLQLPEDDPRREMVIAIRDAGARMTTMSRQLLALSGRSPEAWETVGWSDWLDGFVREWRERGGDRLVLGLNPPQAGLTNETRVTVDVRSQADLLRHLLEEVLRAKAGSRPIVLRAIRVEDSPVRWPEEAWLPEGTLLGWELTDPERVVGDVERRTIFEPYASHQTHSGKRGRAGLGLAAAARLAAQLGGRLTCRSESGGGTCFRFAFRPLDTPGGRDGV